MCTNTISRVGLIESYKMNGKLMSAAYIEHRPKSSDPNASTAHYVIVVNGKEEGPFSTQQAAKDKACKDGHRPVHVARERHLQDRAQPAHWRVDPC